MITPKLPHLFYGADYNPDQWPESLWPEDIRLMQEAGVNLVSLPIFSWAKLEPRRGEYEFGWFDRIMGLLHEGGIKVDLATATASPPHWLILEHPDILPVNVDGLTLHPNSRQHYCPNSEAYRERAAALARALAERYGQHPAVVMWHINNEYACHVHACYCDVCAGAFRRWLRGRYPGGLDEVNDRWGTAFWSQWFYAWEEVQPPRKTPAQVNPGLALDYKRFMSDTFVDLVRMEKGILKELSPDLPITTNYPGITPGYDGFAMGAELDFTCTDLYPDVSAPERTLAERDEAAYFRGNFDREGDGAGGDAGYWRASTAFVLDMTRATGGNRPFVLMEQVTTHVNWRPANATKRPGEMRRWSYQAVARGADGVLFFQWRASRAGSEKYHGAMVPHLGEEGRAFQEVKTLGHELKRLDPVVGTRVPAQVAVVLDWPSWWAVEADSKPALQSYLLTLQRYHRALYERNVATDLVQPEADWLAAGYRLVVAPLAYIATDAMAANVRRFVEGGGVFLTSYFSGVVDENDRVHLGGYPHPVLREVLGLVVEEFAPQTPAVSLRLRSETDIFSGKPRGSRWVDLIQLRGAEALATFRDEWFAGRPAVTRHQLGEGAAYYVGTELDFAALDDLLAAVCREAEVAAPVKAPEGVEAVVRRAETGAEFLFLLNAGREPATVQLRTWKGCLDLLGGNRPDKEITLPAEGVAILQR